MQCVAACCSVLQCVAVCGRVLQCVAVCCSVLQCVAACCSVLQCVAVCCRVMRRCVHYSQRCIYFWANLYFVGVDRDVHTRITSASRTINSQVREICIFVTIQKQIVHKRCMWFFNHTTIAFATNVGFLIIAFGVGGKCVLRVNLYGGT